MKFIATVMAAAAGLSIAAASPPATAATASCAAWSFGGNVEFELNGGGTVVFTASGSAASGPATETDQNGDAAPGTVHGGIKGNVIAVDFNGGGDLWHFDASIGADGSAQGVFEHDGGIRTGTWQTKESLKCSAS